MVFSFTLVLEHQMVSLQQCPFASDMMKYTSTEVFLGRIKAQRTSLKCHNLCHVTPDNLCSRPFALQVSVLEAKLKEKCTVDYQVKIFPGQTHGFVHRKREDINPTDKPNIQEARTDMLNWLKKYM